ncbi:MAG TPA: hypothetical protein VGM05_11640 [Planctomycetaceae bacterium]|jgi:hypothetical protein
MPKSQFATLAEVKTKIGTIAESMKIPGTPVFSTHLEPLAAAILKLVDELEALQVRMDETQFEGS